VPSDPATEIFSFEAQSAEIALAGKEISNLLNVLRKISGLASGCFDHILGLVLAATPLETCAPDNLKDSKRNEFTTH